VTTDDRIPAERYAESAREVLKGAQDPDPVIATLALQRANVEALLAIHDQLERLSAIPRPAVDLVPSRDPVGISVSVGCLLGATALGTTAFHFAGWGWLLVLAVPLALIGIVVLGLSVGRRPRDKDGNVIA